MLRQAAHAYDGAYLDSYLIASRAVRVPLTLDIAGIDKILESLDDVERESIRRIREARIVLTDRLELAKDELHHE